MQIEESVGHPEKHFAERCQGMQMDEDDQEVR
jgi:hypothetical protein